MTVDKEVREVSKVEIEDKCGLDMSSYQDLPPSDCNGSAKLANVDAGGDPDGSYVFVDDVKADSVVDSPVDVVDSSGKSCLTGNGVEICVEENGGNVDCCMVESEGILVRDKSTGVGVALDAARACDDAAEAGKVNETAVEEDEVTEPVGADGEVKDHEVVELDLSPKAVESVACQPSLPIESVVEVKEVREPVVAASGVGGAMMKSKEESNFLLNAEQGENLSDEKNVNLEADGGELPAVEEVTSEKQQMQSVGHVDATVESLAASADFFDSGEEKPEAETKIDSNVGVDQNQESQFAVTAELQSDLEQMPSVRHVEETVESHLASGYFVESGEMCNGENKIVADVGVDRYQESPSLVTADVQSDLKHENGVADFPNEMETPMETESAGDSLSNEDLVLQTEQVDRCILEDVQVPSANCSMPEMEDTGKRVDESQHEIQLNENLKVSQSLSAIDCVGPESENERAVTSEIECAGYSTPIEDQVSQIGDTGKCTDESQVETQFKESSQDTKTLLSTVCMKSEIELPEEPKTGRKPISSENLESEDANGCTDESRKGTQLFKSPENAQILLSSDCVRSETTNGDMAVENSGNVLPDPADGKILDKEVENGDSLITENVLTSSTDHIGHGSEVEKLNCENDLCGAPKGAKCLSSGTGLEFGSIGPCDKAPMLWCDDVEHEVSNGDSEPPNGLAPGYHDNYSQHNGSLPDVKSKCEAEHSSDVSSRDIPSKGVVVTTSEILDGKVVAFGAVDESICGSESVHGKLAVSGRDGYEQDGEGVSDDKARSPGKECIDDVQSDLMPTSLPESSVSDSTAGQEADTEVITRPFNFLIRIPRFEDEKLGEEIRHVQLQLEEKTRLRDAIQVEIQTRRANCRAHRERFEAAKLEERAARRLVKQKRQEIDSLQSVINRGKNAVSVDEIDNRIYGMEHMIQHETLDLKDEKYLIREIHKLKHLREQLSSNMGSQDEVQLALEQKDQNEESLKILKKELESLKDTVLKDEAIKIAAGKKYDDESKRLGELQAQVKAANGVRQETYERLSILRQKLSEKHKNFRLYKNDAAAAADFAYRGDKEALHRLCVDQVETLMELWNTDDEFRNEYVRCNMRSTIRRLKTLDGRSLGPDEEPPVLSSYVDERVPRRTVSTPGEAKIISVVGSVEPKKQVSSVEVKQTGEKSAKKVAEEKNQTEKTQDTAKTILTTGSATVSGKDESLEDRKDEEEMQTKEEQELARKAEDLRKAEVAAKLKEQRRLEEKAKAIEALERKKRNAEKAQMRAELRAQKEAEQREKEKEKRLRKKGKKKSPGDAHDGNNNEDDAPTSEITTDAVSKEPEAVKERNISGPSRRPQRPSNYFVKQSKPKAMPPPIRNRGRRRMQQWLWMICPIVLVLALFLLGNTGFFLNLRQQKAAGLDNF